MSYTVKFVKKKKVSLKKLFAKISSFSQEVKKNSIESYVRLLRLDACEN